MQVNNENFILNTNKVNEIIEKEKLGVKLQKHEKLWFDNIRGVRKANIPFALTDEELLNIYNSSKDCFYFAENFCKIKVEDGSIQLIKLREYQKKIIDLYINNKYSILMASRQVGKTISAAIVILWYALFNNDKNIMIVANKGNTVKEIIRKIKEIYKHLPFYLKKGVLVWNERSIVFENGCRIMTENRTKEPSIGFTIDFLYLDEFAKVPSNIINYYYASVIPTVSSVENSKVIITSTPDGFNLFYDLLTNAERDEDDPLKNNYTALRVYWYEVPGRLDTKIKPILKNLKKYNITHDDIIKYIDNLNLSYYTKNNDPNIIFIKYDKNDIKTHINEIRKLSIKYNNETIPLSELCIITNWKEEEIKLIGSEEMFNQEYDIQFITSNKLLFDSDTLYNMKQDSKKFKFIQFDLLNEKLPFSYNQLKWIDDEEIFSVEKMKKYYIFASIDLSEGLNQDYTVLNIFKIRLKPENIIENNYKKYNSIYDYFQVEQIGLFRSNIHSIKECAELFYLLFFELFDPEKVNVVLEYNTYGSTLLSEMRNVFNGENEYTDAIFLRYKHKKDDIVTRIGIKINSGENEASKKMLVKDFQNAIKNDRIKIYNDININEITLFTKQETSNGNFTYKCESGNDDTVMTLITLSSIFNNIRFKEIVEILYESELNENEKQLLNKYLYNSKEYGEIHEDGYINIIKDVHRQLNNINKYKFL